MKSLIQSKTFWFGVLQIAFGAVGFVFHLIDATTATSLVVTGLGTIGFRVGTSTPIGSVFPKT